MSSPETPISEKDKLIVQDLLTERGKLLDSVADGFKYGGVAIAGLIAWVAAQQPPVSPVAASQTQWNQNRLVALLGLTVPLIAGFLLFMNHRLIRLKSVLEKLNRRLQRYGESYDDTKVIADVRRLMWISLVLLCLVFSLEFIAKNERVKAVPTQTPVGSTTHP